MKTLSTTVLFLLAAAGLCSCHHVKEDAYTRAAKTLDAVDEYRQQWGSLTISDVVPVPAADLFGFDPGKTDKDYLANAQSEINVSAAQSLANSVITSLGARASMAQPINMSKAPTTTQPALPTAPDANVTAAPLPLKDLGATTIPMRLALLQAYNDKVFAKILDLTGHPTLPKGHKLLALVCVASCVPGTQTRVGYKGVLLGSVDYAKHPSGAVKLEGKDIPVEDASQWYYGIQDSHHFVPGILAVLPLSDSQFIRENNLNKDISTLALSLAALFEAQGINIGADAMFKASKELDTSRDSTVAEAATMAMPTARGFSLIFNPTFQAVGDLAAKKSSPAYKLQAQTFPIVILVDLNPLEAPDYHYLSVSVEPRWESMDGSQPSPSIKKTVEIAGKLDQAYADVNNRVGSSGPTASKEFLANFQSKLDEAVAKANPPPPAAPAPPANSTSNTPPPAADKTVTAQQAPPPPSPAPPAPAVPPPAANGTLPKNVFTELQKSMNLTEAVYGGPNLSNSVTTIVVKQPNAPATPATPGSPETPAAEEKPKNELTISILSVGQAAGSQNFFKNLVLKGSLDSLYDRAVGYQQFVDISSYTAQKKDKPTVELVPAGTPIASGAGKKFYLLASDTIDLPAVTLCSPDGNFPLTPVRVMGNDLLFEVTLPPDPIPAFATGNHVATLSVVYKQNDPQLIPVAIAGKKEETDTKDFTLKWDDKGKLIGVTVPKSETIDTDANVIKSLSGAFTIPAPAAAKPDSTAKPEDAATPAPARGTGTGGGKP